MSVAAPNPFSPEVLAAKALEHLGADAPTTESLLRVAAQMAVLVNKAPGLHGPEKSALVQRVLREVINMPAVRSKLSDEAASALILVIDTVVPTTLTLIVSAGRGEFDLKKITPAKAWAWCCKHGVAIAVAASASEKQDPKVGTASIVTAVSDAVAAVAAEVTVDVAAAPAPAPAPVVAESASSAPTESANPTPAP